VIDARGLRLEVFSDTFAPQVNGVSRTLERLVTAFERRRAAVLGETVDVPGALPDPLSRASSIVEINVVAALSTMTCCFTVLSQSYV